MQTETFGGPVNVYIFFTLACGYSMGMLGESLTYFWGNYIRILAIQTKRRVT